ncbi:MAG: trehalose-phosphatase, partial [Hyphomicrobiales bacterium]|nr:trehalose-phosphatase [Hyphomicrobiales bacterium]
RPENAKATTDTLEILQALYPALGGALAIVSGRRIEEIDMLFAPLRLPASGIHGAQLRRTPE